MGVTAAWAVREATLISTVAKPITLSEEVIFMQRAKYPVFFGLSKAFQKNTAIMESTISKVP